VSVAQRPPFTLLATPEAAEWPARPESPPGGFRVSGVSRQVAAMAASVLCAIIVSENPEGRRIDEQCPALQVIDG
jgi:hypothetical protein